MGSLQANPYPNRWRNLFGFTVIAVMGTGALLIWFVTSAYFYGPPKKVIEFYTHTALSRSTSVDRYSVENSFLDGPSFYFELTLSPDDKTHLVKFFDESGTESGPSNTATEAVPASWRRLDDQKPIHYHIFDASKNAVVLMDIGAASGKALLVVWNL